MFVEYEVKFRIENMNIQLLEKTVLADWAAKWAPGQPMIAVICRDSVKFCSKKAPSMQQATVRQGSQHKHLPCCQELRGWEPIWKGLFESESQNS